MLFRFNHLKAFTPGGVQKHVTDPPPGVLAHSEPLRSTISGVQWGRFFWGATLFCGFLVLITSQTTTMDGFVRRWVDVIWTASPQMRRLEADKIKYVYFTLLMVYAARWFGQFVPPMDRARACTTAKRRPVVPAKEKRNPQRGRIN